jgi:hypothetical protein
VKSKVSQRSEPVPSALPPKRLTSRAAAPSTAPSCSAFWASGTVPSRSAFRPLGFQWLPPGERARVAGSIVGLGACVQRGVGRCAGGPVSRTPLGSIRARSGTGARSEGAGRGGTGERASPGRWRTGLRPPVCMGPGPGDGVGYLHPLLGPLARVVVAGIPTGPSPSSSSPSSPYVPNPYEEVAVVQSTGDGSGTSSTGAR